MTEFSLDKLEKALQLSLGSISGTDSDDRIYESIKDLWNFELEQQKTSSRQPVSTSSSHDSQWYSAAYQYWEAEANCPLSDDGVLGGFGKLTPIDVRDSNIFLDQLYNTLRPQLGRSRAADMGAGIGRVTKYLLLPRFDHVDLIEQSPRLLEGSAEYIGSEASRTTCIVQGLQDFKTMNDTSDVTKYDVIWIQWVVGHLTDQDFVTFFHHCVHDRLKPGGVVILKDNCCSGDWHFVVDRTDRSVARCREYMHTLFQFAGCEIILQTQQTDFPSELYPVYMTALVSSSSNEKSTV